MTQNNCIEIAKLIKSMGYLIETKKNLILEFVSNQYRTKRTVGRYLLSFVNFGKAAKILLNYVISIVFKTISKHLKIIM